MKQLPKEERPRERLRHFGSQALATAELIAVILGSGTKGKSVISLAHELLAKFGSLRELAEASIEELCQVKGMGEAKAIQLKASLSLASRLSRKSKPHITSPHHVYLWIRDLLAHEKKEIFGVILQNIRGQILRWEVVSIGILTRTLVHPREVFVPAIRHHAASLILAHNHPSGDPTPSPQDYHVTRLLVTASQSVGIPIMDHIIIGSRGFISLKEAGYPFSTST
ncbi:MAG: DNA repair protein RadC [Chlamydiales bacterium]